MDPTPAGRILIVRLSAIGDVLHGLPVINALREAMPQAFLAWVVEGRAADLLRGHAAIDQLVVAPRGWLKSLKTILDVRRQLQALNIDTTIDLQGLSKSAIAARLSGARRRIGFGGHDGREISRWLNNVLVTPNNTHVVDRNLELLRPLGIQPPSARFALPESAADAATAEKLVASLNESSANFAVINPGAGWPSKIWPAERFAEVARHLGIRGLPTLVAWAGPQERAWAEQIVAGSAGQASLAPQTSLTELAAIVRRARLFVSSDTGPLHLAAAVGTPCVGLFGPMPAERNGPYGPGHIALQEICLKGSSRERRSAGPESMLAIRAEQVCDACDRLLAVEPQARQCA